MSQIVSVLFSVLLLTKGLATLIANASLPLASPTSFNRHEEKCHLVAL